MRHADYPIPILLRPDRGYKTMATVISQTHVVFCLGLVWFSISRVRVLRAELRHGLWFCIAEVIRWLVAHGNTH